MRNDRPPEQPRQAELSRFERARLSIGYLALVGAVLYTVLKNPAPIGQEGLLADVVGIYGGYEIFTLTRPWRDSD